MSPREPSFSPRAFLDLCLGAAASLGVILGARVVLPTIGFADTLAAGILVIAGSLLPRRLSHSPVAIGASGAALVALFASAALHLAARLSVGP